MNNDSLVAINVIVNDKLINNDYIPLLYYWNGKNDIITNLKNDSNFNEFLTKNNVFENCLNFYNSKITYFYYNNSEYTSEIKDICSLYNIEDTKIFENTFKEILNSKYYDAYDEYPNFEIMDIKSIYQAILNKFSNKISEQTFINSVRAYIYDNYNKMISNNDIEKFIYYIKNIIN